ncbi:trypsin-like peptidase domain-containing protein [Candidatus Pelagibacter sp.]|nr:trypsin-like peptidase domain-containing protein [Candidatus Pelagibacter sp.]
MKKIWITKILSIFFLTIFFPNTVYAKIVKLSECYLIDAKPKKKYVSLDKFDDYNKEKDDWIIDTDRSKISHIIKYNSVIRLGVRFDISQSKKGKGLYIKKLEKKSAAKKQGLKVGDRILEINGIEVNNWEDFKEFRNKYLRVQNNSAPKLLHKIKRGNKVFEKEIIPDIIPKTVHTDTFNLNYFDGDDASGKHIKFKDNDVDIDIKNSLVIHKVDYGDDGFTGMITFKLQCKNQKSIANSNGSMSGSAFFVSNKGHLITNYHVVENCSTNPKIYYKDKEIVAKLIAQDKYLDLALLKTDVSKNNFLRISDKPSSKLQKIIAAGYPFGKYLSDDLKFTSGIISSLKGLNDDSTRMQIDAALNPGNSGGPVVDEETGNVLGVAVSGLSKSKTEAINYAIKGILLKSFLLSNQVELRENKNKISRDKVAKNLEETTLYIFCN